VFRPEVMWGLKFREVNLKTEMPNIGFRQTLLQAKYRAMELLKDISNL
jgi:hypothetical protein